MLMSQRDIDILRLLRWCKFIDKEALAQSFTSTEIQHLLCHKLIKVHKASASLIITAKGNQFLETVLPDLPQNTPPAYRPLDTKRRRRLAQIMLTCYHGGLAVFLTTVSQLLARPGFYLSATTRSRGTNLWGSSRVAGLTVLGEILFAIHYVMPNIGNVSMADEMAIFNRHIVLHSITQYSFCFAGATYSDILWELEQPPPTGQTRLISYGQFYQQCPYPIHLLSCDQVGSLQLMIMCQPDYRNRIARLALGRQYAPPNPEQDCDGTYQQQPFYVAVDMDIKRLDKGCATGIISMVALDGQAESILNQRYRDTGKAKVFVLTQEALARFFGQAPHCFYPPDAPYKTAKGEVVYAPPV